jgi:hypothetical protein
MVKLRYATRRSLQGSGYRCRLTTAASVGHTTLCQRLYPHCKFAGSADAETSELGSGSRTCDSAGMRRWEAELAAAVGINPKVEFGGIPYWAFSHARPRYCACSTPIIPAGWRRGGCGRILLQQHREHSSQTYVSWYFNMSMNQLNFSLKAG